MLYSRFRGKKVKASLVTVNPLAAMLVKDRQKCKTLPSVQRDKLKYDTSNKSVGLKSRQNKTISIVLWHFNLSQHQDETISSQTKTVLTCMLLEYARIRPLLLSARRFQFIYKIFNAMSNINGFTCNGNSVICCLHVLQASISIPIVK